MDESSPRSIREFLFDETKSYIFEKSPFYQKFRDTPGTPLPIIDKEVVRENWREFVCLPGAQDYSTILTGSTTGIPLMLMRTREEIRRCAEFRSVAAGKGKNLILRLESGNHGSSNSTLQSNVVELPLKFARHFDLVAKVLQDGYPTPGGFVPVSILVGGTVSIKRLYTYILENEIEISPALAAIYCGGTHLSEQWRKRLTSLFRCSAYRMYGLAEFIQGNAIECAHCGLLHFPVSVYPELNKDQNAIAPIAELLISHLYPFSELQPLMRYSTGDFFIEGPPCDATSDYSFKFLSRKISTGLSQLTDPPSFVPATSVAEVLETVSYACYRRDSANFKGTIREHKLSNAVFRFFSEGGSVCVAVESNDDDVCGSEHEAGVLAGRFRDQVVSDTFGRHQPHVKCVLVPEGSLGTNIVVY